jgi:hypothetical protein
MTNFYAEMTDSLHLTINVLENPTVDLSALATLVSRSRAARLC